VHYGTKIRTQRHNRLFAAWIDYDNSEILDKDYNYFGIAYNELIINGEEID